MFLRSNDSPVKSVLLLLYCCANSTVGFVYSCDPKLQGGSVKTRQSVQSKMPNLTNEQRSKVLWFLKDMANPAKNELAWCLNRHEQSGKSI